MKMSKFLLRMLLLPIFPIMRVDGDEAGGGDNAPPIDTTGGEKTFTQADVTRMMTEEKAQGRRAALKALGFEDEASAKDAMTKYNEWAASQQTEAEKLATAQADVASAKSAAEQMQTDFQHKLAALAVGVLPESVDDAVALARTTPCSMIRSPHLLHS